MSLHEHILSSIHRATAHVFATMVGMEWNSATEGVVSGAESDAGVVSFIGLAGAWAGTGSLTCSPELACRFASGMLAADIKAMDGDVLDVMAELTNMIVGSVKTNLEAQLGPLGLSIPTVIYGRNFRTRSVNAEQWSVVRFAFDQEELAVKLCLEPLDRPLGEPLLSHAWRQHPHHPQQELNHDSPTVGG